MMVNRELYYRVDQGHTISETFYSADVSVRPALGAPMTWLFMALAVLLFVIAAGRTHSNYLDAQEARWKHDPTPQ